MSKSRLKKRKRFNTVATVANHKTTVVPEKQVNVNVSQLYTTAQIHKASEERVKLFYSLMVTMQCTHLLCNELLDNILTAHNKPLKDTIKRLKRSTETFERNLGGNLDEKELSIIIGHSESNAAMMYQLIAYAMWIPEEKIDEFDNLVGYLARAVMESQYGLTVQHSQISYKKTANVVAQIHNLQLNEKQSQYLEDELAKLLLRLPNIQ